MKPSFLIFFACTIMCVSVKAGEPKASDYFQTKPQLDLAIAAQKGQTNKIDVLLKSGADVNAKGKYGMTVLFWCLLQQNKNGFEFLLEHGADTNVQMDTNAPVLEEELGLAGTSVMELVPQKTDTWYLDQVLKHGGNPNLINPVSKETPIYGVMPSIRQENLKNMEMLIAAGAQVNFQDGRGGYTPLMNAAMSIRYDMAYALLEAGADPTLKDNHGHTIVRFININGPHLDQKGWVYPWYLKVMDVLKSKGMDMDEGKPK
jgi:ankyrin repeat protein